MAKYTVHMGKRYAARIALSFFEALASNDEIAKRLIDVGFIDVKVTGNGEERIAHGTWVGDDQTAELPEQITEVKELEA
jgi:hypothetical protein